MLPAPPPPQALPAWHPPRRALARRRSAAAGALLCAVGRRAAGEAELQRLVARLQEDNRRLRQQLEQVHMACEGGVVMSGAAGSGTRPCRDRTYSALEV